MSLGKRKILFEGKHLVFSELQFTDFKGIERRWESADRKNSAFDGGVTPSAVLIIARTVPDNEIILIRQYRPPAGRAMIEFPAGLIDPGETAAESAARELMEETGFAGKLLYVTNPGYSSPGMSGESIVLAIMEIDAEFYRKNPPVAHPEENENIEVFRVPLDNLAEFIAEQEKAGCGIDSKIYTYLAMKKW